MKSKFVIVTGAPGQDAYFISEILSRNDYKTILTYKNFQALQHNKIKTDSKNIKHVALDITNFDACIKLISSYQPFGIINAAGISSIAAADKNPKLSIDVNFGGVENILESIRLCSPHTKFVNCSSKEIFGNCFDVSTNTEKTQTEKTCKKPTNIYGFSKNLAFSLCEFYREKYGVWASSGILYNHESVMRPDHFFLKKIINWFSRLAEYKKVSNNKFPDKLKVGNLNSCIDITHAYDICLGLFKLLQSEKADDYVFCSGKSMTAGDLLIAVANYFGITNPEEYYEVDPQLFRKNQASLFIKTNYEKAYYLLNWSPKIKLENIIKNMAGHEILRF